MSKFKCPTCDGDSLFRIEMMYVNTMVKPSDEEDRGWDYDDGYEDIAETQGRYDFMDDEEFYCKDCDANFNWSKETKNGTEGVRNAG
jgi:hypothetical protein